MTLLPGDAGTATIQLAEVRDQPGAALASNGGADVKPDSTSIVKPEEVAEKVYRLMQKDLILER